MVYRIGLTTTFPFFKKLNKINVNKRKYTFSAQSTEICKSKTFEIFPDPGQQDPTIDRRTKKKCKIPLVSSFSPLSYVGMWW